jgi:predicted RNA-binding Zn-ribbon protein involved in translation (DUF1610 family)
MLRRGVQLYLVDWVSDGADADAEGTLMAELCPVTGKVKHSRAKAVRQRQHLGKRLHVYRCEHCGAMHVGHEAVKHAARRRLES